MFELGKRVYRRVKRWVLWQKILLGLAFAGVLVGLLWWLFVPKEVSQLSLTQEIDQLLLERDLNFESVQLDLPPLNKGFFSNQDRFLAQGMYRSNAIGTAGEPLDEEAVDEHAWVLLVQTRTLSQKRELYLQNVLKQRVYRFFEQDSLYLEAFYIDNGALLKSVIFYDLAQPGAVAQPEPQPQVEPQELAAKENQLITQEQKLKERRLSVGLPRRECQFRRAFSPEEEELFNLVKPSLGVDLLTVLSLAEEPWFGQERLGGVTQFIEPFLVACYDYQYSGELLLSYERSSYHLAEELQRLANVVAQQTSVQQTEEEAVLEAEDFEVSPVAAEVQESQESENEGAQEESENPDPISEIVLAQGEPFYQIREKNSFYINLKEGLFLSEQGGMILAQEVLERLSGGEASLEQDFLQVLKGVQKKELWFIGGSVLKAHALESSFLGLSPLRLEFSYNQEGQLSLYQEYEDDLPTKQVLYEYQGLLLSKSTSVVGDFREEQIFEQENLVRLNLWEREEFRREELYEYEGGLLMKESIRLPSVRRSTEYAYQGEERERSLHYEDERLVRIVDYKEGDREEHTYYLNFLPVSRLYFEGGRFIQEQSLLGFNQ